MAKITVNKREKPWVTASEVGTADICPYQLYLKQKGVKRSEESVQSIRRGNVKHEQYNEQHSRSSSGVWRIILVSILVLAALFLLLLVSMEIS